MIDNDEWWRSKSSISPPPLFPITESLLCLTQNTNTNTNVMVTLYFTFEAKPSQYWVYVGMHVLSCATTAYYSIVIVPDCPIILLGLHECKNTGCKTSSSIGLSHFIAVSHHCSLVPLLGMHKKMFSKPSNTATSKMCFIMS